MKTKNRIIEIVAEYPGACPVGESLQSRDSWGGGSNEVNLHSLFRHENGAPWIWNDDVGFRVAAILEPGVVGSYEHLWLQRCIYPSFFPD